MKLPKKLYKYEALSVRSLLNLKSQTIYFSPPSGFNDPYDCAIKAELRDPSDDEILRLKDTYLAKGWPERVVAKLESLPLNELKETLMRSARQANEDVIDKFITSKGVSCFSEVNDELLMWAHYSDKYTGFCLEFRTDNELFEKAKKVNYVDKFPTLSIEHVYVDGERTEILKLFCTKSKSWQYEKEWRVIHSDAGTAYTYPAEALTGVYFGPNMQNEAVEIVCLILQGQNPNVKFYRGERSSKTFKVEFKEFTHTSCVNSKNG